MRAISWTSALVSLALAVLARSWESFAWRHGWVETWTFAGREDDMIVDERKVKRRDVNCVELSCSCAKRVDVSRLVEWGVKVIVIEVGLCERSWPAPALPPSTHQHFDFPFQEY